MKKIRHALSFRLVAGFLYFLVLYALCQHLLWVALPLWLQTLLLLLTGCAFCEHYKLIYGFLEQRRIDELAPRKAGPDLLLGLFFGVLMLGCSVGLIVLAGSYRIESVQFDGMKMLRFAALCWLIAACEEVLFRGILFRILAGRSRVLALLVSGALFGLVHLFNPSVNILSLAAIAVEAGVMLAAAYCWRGTLWFPIGIHWTWNFGLGYWVGLPVSGWNFDRGVTAYAEGPDWLTGGAFGPEGALQTVVAGTLLAVLFLVWARRRRMRLAERFSETADR